MLRVSIHTMSRAWVDRVQVAQVGQDELGARGRAADERVPVEQPERDAAGGQVGGEPGADGPGRPGDQQRHGRWWSIAATPSFSMAS
ncbi:hypothetical protein [Streptomyces yaizuensis]|uniref:Uncharacterized protein n=1 Tax=Streptomyces yaizuensis TaxID=2989713 RepID=A0ABQ5NZ44_9ACTN|nr:hypothetical protein [Streptomyces sp. YSPA8]GLF95226.1 hypothetical protein SYYSPA8_13035 [Streptomyces sp. YSPA8]